jgi:hypothetical protein
MVDLQTAKAPAAQIESFLAECAVHLAPINLLGKRPQDLGVSVFTAGH